MDKWDPKWNTTNYASKDNYWAGAKKACNDIGMSLPDKSTLRSLAWKTTAEKKQLGLPTSGWFWSSSAGLAHDVYLVDFRDGDTDISFKYYSGNRVLCVGDQVFLKVYKCDLRKAGVKPRFCFINNPSGMDYDTSKYF